MKKLISRMLCLMLLQLGVVAQTPTPAQQDFNTYRLYHEFFSRVHTVGRMADHAEALGKDQQHVGRKHIQNQIGLSDDEYKIVRSMSDECRLQLEAKLAEGKTAYEAFKSAHPGERPSQDLLQQRTNLEKQRQQIVLDHLAQLKAGLGTTRFQQLDQWVRTSMHSGSIEIIGGK